KSDVDMLCEYNVFTTTSHPKLKYVKEATKCLLILALVCPNFTYSISPSAARKQFKTELEDAIALDMFSYYAPRLQHLLSHGWRNCQTII
ncbi:hypothetical protein GGI17_006636, partial [Coemansia sp. S146]